MRQVKWRVFFGNPNGTDIERAVLPTIIYARNNLGISRATGIAVGWWAWGIGIIRTVTEIKEQNK